MRINNNLMAMNTHRQLGIATTGGAKSMEKLSSGFRINRAGDDAAGLSISEKMRGQIRGLTQASRNAQDGISLIQTAEGALNETHAILQRMRELSVQSSTDTNVNELDREAIDNEFNKLKEEIDRIGNTTEFNTQKLLKGDGKASLDKTNIKGIAGKLGDTTATEGKTTHTGATVDIDIAASLESANLDGKSMVVSLNGQEITINFAEDTSLAKEESAVDTDSITGNSVTIKLHGDNTDAIDADKLAAAIQSGLEAAIAKNETLAGNYDVSVAGDKVTLAANDKGDFAGAKGYIGEIDSASTGGVIAANIDANVGTTAYTQATLELDFSTLDADGVKDLIGKGITIGDTQYEFYDADKGAYEGDAVGINISAVADGTDLAAALAKQLPKTEGYTATDEGAGKLTLEATAKGEAGNGSVVTSDGGVQKDFKATFQIGANEGQTMEVTMRDMRAEALGINKVDLSTRETAEAGITTINDAINKVSNQRSELGAFQNRLEHTIKNLDNSAENLQAAESRIRDVDMAKEMMEQTKQNILQQAATAMLAQANSAPQGVLQLLR